MSTPRILIKPDWFVHGDRQRGCILTLQHLRNPRVLRILEAAAETAPTLIDNEMLVSEGWRDIRDTPDAHERHEAFDFSLNQVAGHGKPHRLVCDAWAERMQAKLGDDYYVVVHGTGTNLHIHCQIRKPPA